MRRITIIYALVIVTNMGCAQNSSRYTVESFVNDLKSEEIKNTDLIKKYFQFNDSLTDNRKNETVTPLIANQIDRIREKMSKDCTSIEIISHNDNSVLIQSYKLKAERFDIKDIYYVLCNDSVLLPILSKGSKILSISVYSKSENGKKTSSYIKETVTKCINRALAPIE